MRIITICKFVLDIINGEWVHRFQKPIFCNK